MGKCIRFGAKTGQNISWKQEPVRKAGLEDEFFHLLGKIFLKCDWRLV